MATAPTPPPPPFRLATSDDAAEVVQLVNAAYHGGADGRRGWTDFTGYLDRARLDEAEFLGHVLGDPARRCMLVLPREDELGGSEETEVSGGGVLVGCVVVEATATTAHEVELGMLAVRPSAQGGGVGGRLVAAAEALAAARFGARRVVLTVLAQRGEVTAWYERRGYRLTGEREAPGYGDGKFGTRPQEGEDGLVFERMAKDLQL